MNRMKSTMLIAALAAAGLVAAGCQQQTGSDKTGKTDQANPSMMGKAQPGGDQTAQSSPAPSSSQSVTIDNKGQSDQTAKPDQSASSNPPASSDQDKDKAKAPDKQS